MGDVRRRNHATPPGHELQTTQKKEHRWEGTKKKRRKERGKLGNANSKDKDGSQ